MVVGDAVFVLIGYVMGDTGLWLFGHTVGLPRTSVIA